MHIAHIAQRKHFFVLSQKHKDLSYESDSMDVVIATTRLQMVNAW